ncbi:MAG: HEAT repeat domain-containing protein [Gemmatimonadota bacterium]|nr:MAG: HEAT repeat domain-containing protein [Gemmatimonadota bacterium]
MMFYSAQKARTVVIALVSVCILLGMFSLSYADAKNADLIEMLSSENRGWRYSAAQLLGERKVAEAVEPLIERLKVEKDSSLRLVVLQALHKIGDPKAIPALKKVANSDRNRTVRHMAAVLATNMEKYAYAPQ